MKSENPEFKRSTKIFSAHISEATACFLCNLRRGRLTSKGLRVSMSDAFSMIEIALALAIVGIALVSILGLMATVLNSAKDATDDNMSAILAKRILADRFSSPYESETPISSAHGFKIPPLNFPDGTTWHMCFGKDGGFLGYDSTTLPNSSYYDCTV
ncbi:MAG: type IV pilus modification PilV family protein, partial [Verrucomicrobiia bacterium]